ncbi:MFS transporter [Nocardiopsis sp. NPDC055824]
MTFRRPRPRRRRPAGTEARGALAALCVTVTVSQGVLFYAFPVLGPAIAEDTGWSLPIVIVLFSGSQVMAGLSGPFVARWLRLRGPRAVMTAAALLGALAIVGVALAPDLWFFGAAWQVAGIAVAGLSYPPAFAALTRWYGPRRVRALTFLTLVGGLASTVFAPLTAALEAQVGWRGTYLVLALILALVAVPLHALALSRPWNPARAEDRIRDRTAVRAVLRSGAFWALTTALALGTLTVYAVVVAIVPLMQERGYGTTEAAWALGVVGVGQVLGRLAYAPLARISGSVHRIAVVLLACAAATALLALVSGPLSLVIGAAALVGSARGVLTLLQATAVADRWGEAHYTTLNGVMHTPLMLTMALAPGACALLSGPMGGYAAVFLLLAGLSVLGAVVALASGPKRARPAPA